MEISPQILKSPNKRVQRVKESPQISKKPNKRARNSPQISKKPNKRARNSPQISKNPNKYVVSDYAKPNPYDHQPNADKSYFFEGWERGGINE